VTVEPCIFCALVDGRIPARKVFEDDAHVAFLPLRHINPGHTLLVPRRHDESLFAMDDAAYHAIFAVAKRLAPPVQRVSEAKRVGLLVEGFSVPHVHVHLVPVNALGDIDPARERSLADVEADRLAQRLREAIASAVSAGERR
jgi:histidine triad (HIT) family protein